MSLPKVDKPTQPNNRIGLLDIYRGFALFGIFVVNIRYMTSSVLHPEAFKWMGEGTLNKITWFIIDNFFNSKFFPIFSLLFGVGFALQINSMESKGHFSSSFFLRRYFFLMLFGVAHLLFIWQGDVLILYALAGVLVLILRKIKLKYMVLIALGILLFPGTYHLNKYISDFLLSKDITFLSTLNNYNLEDIIKINTEASFVEQMKFRIYEYTVYFRNVEYFPTLLFMILIGYVAGRAKFYEGIEEKFKSLNKYAFISIIYIIVIRVSYVLVQDIMNQHFYFYIFFTKLTILSNICQAFLYLWLIAYIYKSTFGKLVLQPMAYAGRMSLTNYLMQSVVGYILFLVIGLYAKFDLFQLFLISIVVYIALLQGSKLWFKEFRFGPLEWIWRQLSYKTRLKFIKNNKN